VKIKTRYWPPPGGGFTATGDGTMTPEHFAKTLLREMKSVAPWSDVVDVYDIKDVRIEGDFDMIKLAAVMLRYFEPKVGLVYVDGLPVGVVTASKETRTP
jgi:hypothetical protein